MSRWYIEGSANKNISTTTIACDDYNVAYGVQRADAEEIVAAHNGALAPQSFASRALGTSVLRDRIAEEMDCEPDDDDDLVEAVAILVADAEAARDARATCRDEIQIAVRERDEAVRVRDMALAEAATALAAREAALAEAKRLAHDLDEYVSDHDALVRQREEVQASNRHATQRIVEAIGSVGGPEGLEGAVDRIVGALQTQNDETALWRGRWGDVGRERDGLRMSLTHERDEQRARADALVRARDEAIVERDTARKETQDAIVERNAIVTRLQTEQHELRRTLTAERNEAVSQAHEAGAQGSGRLHADLAKAYAERKELLAELARAKSDYEDMTAERNGLRSDLDAEMDARKGMRSRLGAREDETLIAFMQRVCKERDAAVAERNATDARYDRVVRERDEAQRAVQRASAWDVDVTETCRRLGMRPGEQATEFIERLHRECGEAKSARDAAYSEEDARVNAIERRLVANEEGLRVLRVRFEQIERGE